ncbi:AMP-binding protein [Geomonas sp. RF6]|uniref:AMP-binding protein n=1 Tax=Geomonas sp. RF6 TaxID=2897342 RepID=UPI001E4E4B35|nr:AMP-binding protein [Geomonas sp. RF6]UFS71133.1 AMP-binding protein [Geomonas sp. RF6]
METLLHLFETFRDRGEKIVFVNRTGVRRQLFTYRELHERSLQMAALLQERGVGVGDRVLLWGPNSPWWGIAFWGIMARGAIAVPVDFMSDRERAETISTLTEAKVLLQSRMKPERIVAPGTVFLEDLQYLLPELSPVPAPEPRTPEDTAQLIYTSGTTGNPKGVILTHANLVANLLQVQEHIPIISADYHFLSLLPLSHMFEQMGGFLTPLHRGASIVYLRTLKPSAILEALAQEDIYAVVAVPRLLQLLKHSIEEEIAQKKLTALFSRLMALSPRLSRKGRRLLFYPVHKKFGANFVLFVSGGAPLPPDTFLFWQALGFTVMEGYGLTECSPVLAANSMERQVPGAVGRALPGVTLKVVDGEVLAAGANVFPGYYKNEKATKEAFSEDGFFRTGDLGEIAPDGWLTIKGRQKELIVTGSGINVYPDDLEGILDRSRGVRESTVVGIDKGGGEEVHAVLILDGSGRSAEEIVREANARLDPLHQIASFSVWDEPEFPKTTTLKVRKFLVKEKILKGAQGGKGGVSGDRLIALLARITGTDPGSITEDSRLVTDLGLSSIDRVELVNYLEQEFRLDIEDSQIGAETRVKDVRELIAKREKVHPGGHFRFWTNSSFIRGLRAVSDAILLWPVVRSFVTLKVEGGEHLRGISGPVFFVANHLSYLDQPSVMCALPRPIRYRCATAAYEEFFFAKYRNLAEKIWKLTAYQLATLLLNVFPLPQSRGFSGSLKFMGRLADAGIHILIFPEGQHSKDGTLGRFQMGLGIMVKEVGIPVVPVAIEGTRELLPPGSGWPRRGTVTVRFAPPLRFTFEEPGEIVDRTRDAVVQLQRGEASG